MSMMRTVKAVIVAAAVVLLSGASASPARAAVDFGFFYSDLGPHGSWLVSAQYGRVWQPYDYRPGWNPYYDGHWVYSDCGWTWVSDYGWGDVPYHYGTWYQDAALGWVWVPGYTWAPSWVVFRTGPDVIGWAPVSPGFSVGVSFGAPVASSFVFVSNHDFLAPRIRAYAVGYGGRRDVYIRNTRVVDNITVQNNVVVNRGPDVRYVERVSGRRIQTVPVERVERSRPRGFSSRSDIAIDPGRRQHAGVRAAEPFSARQPVPGPGERPKDRDQQQVRRRGGAGDAPHAQERPVERPRHRRSNNRDHKGGGR